MNEQQDDGQLLRAFAVQGDESAFAELMRRHGSVVRSAACSVVGSANMAEDIAQATFLTLARMPKTEALQANLARINPYVRVEVHTIRVDHSNVAVLFGDVDVLVEAFDTPEAKAMLMESFLVRFPGKPLVMATGLAGYESSNSIRTTRVGKNLYVVGDLVTAAQPGRGLMAPRVGVTAHHQANAVLRILMGVDPVQEEQHESDA